VIVMANHHMEDRAMAIRITKDITCRHCGHSGQMGIQDEREDRSGGCLFRYLGHDIFPGNLHYECPACGISLLVNPLLALGERPIMGIPQLRKSKKTAREEGLLQGFISRLLTAVFPDEFEELC